MNDTDSDTHNAEGDDTAPSSFEALAAGPAGKSYHRRGQGAFVSNLRLISYHASGTRVHLGYTGEKSGGPLQDVPLLPEDPVLSPQPLQLGRRVRPRRSASALGPAVAAPADPADQRRQADTEIPGDLPLRPTARQSQPNRFVLKLLREPSLLRHGDPHASLGTLHFSEASPGGRTPAQPLIDGSSPKRTAISMSP